MILKKGVKGIDLLDKVLWAFMMRDHGTSEFFYEVVSMIKKYDRENMVYPKQLATFCSHLSKLSNNVGGGFGLYKITEDKLEHYLPKMDFHELANICQLLVPQMACSKELVTKLMDRLIDQITRFDKLEESILNRKIEVDPSQLETFDLKITVGDLVRLLKAFSSYQFRGKPLIEKLLARLVFYTPGMSNQQIESVLWSLTKGGFANNDLYKAIEKELSKRLPSLSFRGLSFSFTELVEYGQINPQLFLRYMKEIIARSSSEQFGSSVHYYLLIFKGVIHSGYVLNNEMPEKTEMAINDLRKVILNTVMKKLEDTIAEPRLFRVRDIMKITDLFREGMSMITTDPRIASIFEKLESLFLLNYKSVDKSGIIGLESEEDEYIIQTGNEPEFSFDDLCRVFVNYTMCNLGSKHFMDQLTQEINSKVVMITKRSFCSTFFALVNCGRCENPKLFSAIIYELHKYGDFKFFFSHRDFIKLVWSLLTTQFQDRYQVCEYPLNQAFLVLSPQYLDSDVAEGTEDEDIFHHNFEIMKQLTKVTRKSILEIGETLMEIDPNTLDAFHLKLNVQSMLLIDFLLKGQMRTEITNYLSQVNEYLASNLILQNIDKQTSGKTLGMIRDSLETRLKALKNISTNVITNFVDENYIPYDLCVEFSPNPTPVTTPQDPLTPNPSKETIFPFKLCLILWSSHHSVPFDDSRLQGQVESSLFSSSFGNNTHIGMISNDIDIESSIKAIDTIVQTIVDAEVKRKNEFWVKCRREQMEEKSGEDGVQGRARGRRGAAGRRKRFGEGREGNMGQKEEEEQKE